MSSRCADVDACSWIDIEVFAYDESSEISGGS